MFNFNAAAVTLFVCVMIGVLIFSLLFSFRETLREIKFFFDLRSIRSGLRSLLRFRLRTLLIAFIVIQFCLGIGLWMFREGEPVGEMWFYLVSGLLVAGFLWCCFSDALRPTTSQRWKSILKRDRVALPDDLRSTTEENNSSSRPPDEVDRTESED